MLYMHTPLSLDLRQWFSIGVVTFFSTACVGQCAGRCLNTRMQEVEEGKA
jgi:hypothetical protein